MAQTLPLAGVRIVDLGQAVAVPFATQWLGYMGAQVIQVESHQHLGIREWPAFADGVPGVNRSAKFNLFHCNKMSCTLNLRTPAGGALLRRLVGVSDIVIENFSTGTMERLGLGYDELRRLRPDIIMLSMAAFGRTGPMKQCVGYHSAVYLFSGLAALTGYVDSHPRIVGSVFPDPLSAGYAVLAVLQALYQRARTGQGQYIDLAMSEALMTLMPEAILDYTLNGREARRRANRDLAKAPHGVYPCQGEEAWVAISVSSDQEWQAICQATGHHEWGDDPRFSDALARWHHQDELDDLLTAWTQQHDPSEVMHRLQGAGVPAGPSHNARGLLEDPQLRERGSVVTVDHPEVGPRLMAGVPWKISDLPPVEYQPPPLIGQHNHAVLCQLLGLPEEEVQRLTEEGVVH